MSQTREILAICPHCSGTHKLTVYSGINVVDSPELREKVMNGSLFTWDCPHCGSMNLVSEPVLYHDPAKSLMIWLSGTGSLPEEKLKAVFSSDESLKNYTARLVDSIGDLIEKVKIFDSGLEDTVMEMCKYVTRMELAGNCHDAMKEEAISSAPFRFLRMDGADGDITLAYPLDGQMQMVAIGFNVYEDCLGIIRRNPAITESASGLTKVDADWLAGFFR